MFYKYQDEQLSFGPYITFPDREMLHIDKYQEYTYPIEGWYYFATEQEAKDFFGINDND